MARKTAPPTTKNAKTRTYWLADIDRLCSLLPITSTTIAMTKWSPTCTAGRLPMRAQVGVGVTRRRWNTPWSRSRATVRA
jgi:hypothetical protein